MLGIIHKPNTEEKLDLLTASARHDVCLVSCSGNLRGGPGRLADPRDPVHRWIYPAQVPGKGPVGILKVLQTNLCRNNCTYCALSAGQDCLKRVGFTPDELARVFQQMVQRRLVQGIFLSSGVGFNTDSAMERMIRTAEILRRRYHFQGYIHLKILPGASFPLIEQAARLADRISMNLEAPTPGHLQALAPDKHFVRDLLRRLKWAGDLIKAGTYARSQTTQFVVGACRERDVDILKSVDWVYRELYVFRAYFSAYQPGGPVQPGPPQADLPGAPPREDHTRLREHRLYQSDFLLRGYGFRFADLVFDGRGELPRNVDPKTAYAMMHPEIFPVEVNRAAEERLLKVPGIGPLSARRIVEGRGKNPFHRLEELKGLGVIVKRAAPYVECSGRGVRATGPRYSQQWLFEEMSPRGWTTGLKPYQIEKIDPGIAGLSEDSPAAPDRPYPYPGQQGKRLYYPSSAGKRVITCR